MNKQANPRHVALETASRINALTDRSVPSVRRVRREISKSIRHWDGASVVRLAKVLVEGDDGVPRWVAYELIDQHPTALANLTSTSVKRLGKGLSSWDEVDAFACYVSGPAWREGCVGDDLIHTWARSKDRWQRRTALVSTVALNCSARGGTGDSQRTLAVCDLLLGDSDDMVVKAMSWALRALIAKDRQAVKQFLHRHANALSARVTREVKNKLTTGLKNPKPKKSAR